MRMAMVVGALVATVLLAGCLGDDAGSVADEITRVSQDTSLEEGDRATLVGSLHAEGDVVRLCAAHMESHQPQCGQPSVEVEGLDLDGMDGISSDQGVSWSDGELQVNGKIRDGVLHAD